MSSKLELRLMLIDSDEDLLFLLKALLEITGCEVHLARSYTEAFELINGNKFDVIFTELFLEKISIVELAKKFRLVAQADTLLIMLTGYYYKGIAQDAWIAGFNRFLLKPVQYDQILLLLKGIAQIRQRTVAGPANLPKAAA